MNLEINDTFNRELPADNNRNNSRRQVFNACFSFVKPHVPSHPQLIHTSEEMISALGLEVGDAASDEFLKIFSGSEVLAGTDPYAMCYGGHQFGSWAGQLGDGRAINLAEVINGDQRWALQLKGSGETPYSRSADGLAVLRSSIREHLCSEAMFHLRVPTTRSLSLILSGDPVLRDILYDGNSAYERGAIVCRAAPSFIRFGNFQIFAARKDIKTLRLLTDYTIRHFFPSIRPGSKRAYIEFFHSVANLTLEMVVHWQRVGFVHGVMNTDNMSILGLTIDYGPYGWLEGYDPGWTPNTTDKAHRRYRFGQQPNVALWNLAQLANALYLLVEDVAPLEEVLNNFRSDFSRTYVDMMREKIGLATEKEADRDLLKKLEETLVLTETDMTIFFRLLAGIKKSDDNPAIVLDKISDAFYQSEPLKDEIVDAWQKWLDKYVERLTAESASDEDRKLSMHRVNPKYVLRNYMAQLAIDKADAGDYSLIEELHQLLKRPYDEQPENKKWFAKRPEWARNKVGCSMLSCSS